jgi:hypothetical protein
MEAEVCEYHEGRMAIPNSGELNPRIGRVARQRIYDWASRDRPSNESSSDGSPVKFPANVAIGRAKRSRRRCPADAGCAISKTTGLSCRRPDQNGSLPSS